MQENINDSDEQIENYRNRGFSTSAVKRSRKMAWLVGFLVLVTIALVAWLAIILLDDKNKNVNLVTKDNDSKVVERADGNKPLSNGTANLTNTHDVRRTSARRMINDMRRLMSVGRNYIFENSSIYRVPPVKSSGYDFYTIPDVRDIYEVVADSDNNTVNEKIYQDAKKFAIDKGMTVYEDEKATKEKFEYNYGYSGIYLKDNEKYCSLGMYKKSQYNDDRLVTSFVCADNSAYVEASKKAEPFFKLYSAAFGLTAVKRDDVLFSLSLLDARSGGSDGYEIVFGGIASVGGPGGGKLKFYRTPDGKWHFFKEGSGGQVAPSCSDYNTDDLKKAYLGDRCYDKAAGNESQVKL